MKYKISFLFILLIITGCSNYFENGFHRVDRNSSFFYGKYGQIDTISINQIRFCKTQNEIRARKIKTQGKVEINSKHIKENIVESLKKNFNYVDYNFKSDTNWNQNCGYLEKGRLLNNYYKSNLKPNNHYSVDITLDIEYDSSRNYEVDGSYNVASFILLDGDRHDIKYHLRLAIIYGNDLVYLDNCGTLEKLFCEKDEMIKHKVPKKIIDSLISKSLTEYFKRIE